MLSTNPPPITKKQKAAKEQQMQQQQTVAVSASVGASSSGVMTPAVGCGISGSPHQISQLQQQQQQQPLVNAPQSPLQRQFMPMSTPPPVSQQQHGASSSQ